MLKVLIADDEYYVRQGVKNIIPWEECGFEVCGEGTNGDETYEKIFSLKPDLVLIDIKMPGKSGLEVIKESIENGFKGKFIIVSGYSEFKYAKEAMEYGVKSYILKPIDEDELIDIVNKLKVEIYDEIRISQNNKVKNQLIKEHLLSQLCLNNKLEEVSEEINSIKGKRFTVVLLYNYKEGFYDENIIELEQRVKAKLVINNTTVFKVKNRVAIIFIDKGIDSIYTRLEKFKNEIEKLQQEKLFITVGHVVNKISDIYLSYDSAEDLMKKRYLYLNKGIVSEDKMKIYMSNKITEEDILDSLYTYIEIGEVSEIKKNLQLLENLIIENKYEKSEVRALLTTFYIELKDRIIANYQLKESLDIENKITIKEIHDKCSLHEVIEVLNRKLVYISKNISLNSSDKGIKRIVRYVDNKYNSDLKLETLAEIFNYNSSYLGKLFKDNTGKNFNTYLDMVRIEEAKKLLVQDKLKVYEICEKVGYKNTDYFYCKFKKYVGTSPLNYKKELQCK